MWLLFVPIALEMYFEIPESISAGILKAVGVFNVFRRSVKR
jgi:hypothetical protein